MNNQLHHHGVKGQKWGIRRYQNEDGTRTPAGEKQQRKLENKALKKELNKVNKTTSKMLFKPNSSSTNELFKQKARVNKAAKYVKKYNMSVEDAMKKANSNSRKKAAAFTAGLVGLTVGSMYLNSRKYRD